MKRVAYIWWCGDDYCDCTQAIVEDVRPNPKNLRFVIRKRVAEGTFFTDGEGSTETRIERDHLALLYGAETQT